MIAQAFQKSDNTGLLYTCGSQPLETLEPLKTLSLGRGPPLKIVQRETAKIDLFVC